MDDLRVLLLDTTCVPAADRAEAFHEAMASGSVVNKVVHEEPAEGIRARMELWSFGRVNVLASTNTGFRLIRTPRLIRMDSDVLISLALQVRGTARYEQQGEQMHLREGDLLLTDLTRPREYGWSGEGAAQALLIPYQLLGLSLDLVRQAVFRLPSSPLYPLVSAHLTALGRDLGRLSRDPGASALGNATLELARGLIRSAVGDDALLREAMADTLLTRVLAYVGDRIADTGLPPQQIAAAHNVSVRHLYQVFERAGMSLEQWLIERRLEAARVALADPRASRRTIAAIALSCGFTSASHFTRRFRQAYGCTPSEWRAAARAG